MVREAKEKALLRTKKREEKKRKDKAKRDSLLDAIKDELYIVSSEDSTETGDEEAQKRNKLSNLKKVSTVEEESIRYGLNSKYITTTFDNKPFSR